MLTSDFRFFTFRTKVLKDFWMVMKARADGKPVWVLQGKRRLPYHEDENSNIIFLIKIVEQECSDGWNVLC